MKRHHGKMIDRRVIKNRLILRVMGTDVTVAPRDESDAAELRGGDAVPYVYRGGRAFYAPEND